MQTAQQRLRAMVAQALAATNSAAPARTYQPPVNGNLSTAQATPAVNVANANADPDHDNVSGKPADEEDWLEQKFILDFSWSSCL